MARRLAASLLRKLRVASGWSSVPSAAVSGGSGEAVAVRPGREEEREERRAELRRTAVQAAEQRRQVARRPKDGEGRGVAGTPPPPPSGSVMSICSPATVVAAAAAAAAGGGDGARVVEGEVAVAGGAAGDSVEEVDAVSHQPHHELHLPLAARGVGEVRLGEAEEALDAPRLDEVGAAVLRGRMEELREEEAHRRAHEGEARLRQQRQQRLRERRSQPAAARRAVGAGAPHGADELECGAEEVAQRDLQQRMRHRNRRAAGRRAASAARDVVAPPRAAQPSGPTPPKARRRRNVARAAAATALLAAAMLFAASAAAAAVAACTGRGARRAQPTARRRGLGRLRGLDLLQRRARSAAASSAMRRASASIWSSR